MRCPMCDTRLPAPASAPADPYLACPGCGGLTLAAYPVDQDNAVFDTPAGAARQAEREAGRRAYFARHLDRVERRAPARGRLLEVGCGSGVLLAVAAARGWEVHALELSPVLADLARENNPGARVTCGDISAAGDGRADYDAVLLLDVIEHVPDPAGVLRNCAAHLVPGGALLVQTPNVHSLRHRLAGRDWEMRDPAQHLNLFTPRGLSGLLARCGFAVASLETLGGTGLEQGWRRTAVAARDRILGVGRWGAALCAVACRRG